MIFLGAFSAEVTISGVLAMIKKLLRIMPFSFYHDGRHYAARLTQRHL